jgi:hypothetical protein
MARPAPIIVETFDLAGLNKKLRVRVYAPAPFERTTWACRTSLGAPFNRDRPTYGEGPLQALVLGLNMVAANLYSSDLWREGRLGWRGRFGGYLGLAAPTSYLDFAPYPFDLGGPEEARRILADAYADPESSTAVVEETFAVTDPLHPLTIRVFRPEEATGGAWRCRIQIDDPIAVDRYALGHSGLEALWRALCLLGSELYGSPLWRAGRLGTVDEPGGFLGVPPPTSLAFLTRNSF